MRRAPAALSQTAKQAERQQEARPASGISRDIQHAGDLQYELAEPLKRTLLLSGPYANQTLAAIVGSKDGRNYLAGIFQIVPNNLKQAITTAITED